MKKSIVSILLAKAPPPSKLGKGKSEGDEPASDDAESDVDDGGDEGNDAAGESATGDFLAAIGHKNPVAAWKAFKEMSSLCEGASGDEGEDDDDNTDDYGE